MRYLSTGWPNHLAVLCALAAPALLPATGALAQTSPAVKIPTTPPANVPRNGTWPINGVVNVAPGNLENSGTISIGPGATLTIMGDPRGTAFSTWTGNGLISLDGGTLILAQNASLDTTNRIHLKSGRVLVGNGAQLRLRGITTVENGSFNISPAAQLSVDGTLFTAQGNQNENNPAILNAGKVAVQNQGNMALMEGARALNSGLLVVDGSTLSVGVVEPGDTTATTVEAKEALDNFGALFIKRSGAVHARGVIRNFSPSGVGGNIFVSEQGVLHVSGGVQVVPGKDGKAPYRKMTGGIRGGYLNIDAQSHLRIPYTNSRIGTSAMPTHIQLDGTLHLEALSGGRGAEPPVDPRRREAEYEGPGGDTNVGAVFPDSSMYALSGSLATGTGTFSITIAQSGSNIKYGQMSIYGDVTLNGGTLSVTKSPSNLNVVGINFDIIVADHIIRTIPPGSTAEPAFSSFSGAASSFDYKHVVPWPTPTPDPYLAVYRIKDSS